jgi:hypothetical protein
MAPYCRTIHAPIGERASAALLPQDVGVAVAVGANCLPLKRNKSHWRTILKSNCEDA